MKTLLLLRHGKSDWDADYGADHERPLAKRGVKAAKRIGRFLKEIDEVPDLVVSSTAVRAQTTAELASRAGEWKTELSATRDLYEASPAAIIDTLRQLPDRIGSVMLVGHEPTWSSSVSVLTGANCRFPTAAACRIDFERDRWADVSFGGGQLIWLVVPNSLPDL